MLRIAPRPVSKRRIVESATPDIAANSRTLIFSAARAILTCAGVIMTEIPSNVMEFR